MAGVDPQITVRAGAAEPVAMELPPGQSVGPLSVGRGGTWRVVAPGVLEEHAFLYFNGTELFLQSANPESPVTVNGAPIPGDWTPVYAPCEIALGGARLWFGPPHQPQRSRPPPVPSKPPPAPVSLVRNMPSPDESTRQVSIEEIQQSVRRPAARDAVSATLQSGNAPPPSFGAAPPPSFGAAPPPSFAPPPQIFGTATHDAAPNIHAGLAAFAPPQPAPPSALPQPDAMPIAAAPEKKGGIGAMWREASGPKKAMIVLMAPLVWAVWVIFTDQPPPARAPKPAASATASPSSTPSAGAASSAPPAVEPPTPVVAPTPSPAPTASGKASAGASTSVKTREREAADAVAVGAYDKAARIYEELAKAHPEVPAYGEAARIMRMKVGKR